MAEAELKPISLVDSTHRIRLEVTKKIFDDCEVLGAVQSPSHTIEIDGEKSEWYLLLFPKGCKEYKNDAILAINYSGDKKYNVQFECGIETPSGFGSDYDFVKEFYSRGNYRKCLLFGKKDEENKNSISNLWGRKLCTTEEFGQQLGEHKVIVVATFVIYGEGNGYRDHMEIADKFVDDIRSASCRTDLSDFKIISGKTRFSCHKFLLAARSEYFRALFRNEPDKKVLKVDESPNLVKPMLDFINKGVIPENIDVEAMDLILMSDMYGLDLLTMACEKSLVNNLSPDNAMETLTIIDKLKHVSKLEHRQKVLTYIKKEAAQIFKNNDWKKFIQNYPDLIREILLLNS